MQRNGFNLNKDIMVDDQAMTSSVITSKKETNGRLKTRL